MIEIQGEEKEMLHQRAKRARVAGAVIGAAQQWGSAAQLRGRAAKRTLLLVVALVCVLAVPLVAQAVINGVLVKVTSLELSSSHASAGESITYTVTLEQPENTTAVYVYLYRDDQQQQQGESQQQAESQQQGQSQQGQQSQQNAQQAQQSKQSTQQSQRNSQAQQGQQNAQQQQVALSDEDADGTFEGTAIIDETWGEGAWLCSAIQVYTEDKNWGYARDDRIYTRDGATDLSAFDVTVDQNDQAVQTQDIAFTSATVNYNEQAQQMDIDLQLYEPASELYLYYATPDGWVESDGEAGEGSGVTSDVLQVALTNAGEDLHYTGSISCASTSQTEQLKQGTTWQCKAVQYCDAAGQWRYLHDARFKQSSSDDLSFLDAVVCNHQWGAWESTSFSTCQTRGEDARTCSVCEKREIRQYDFASHAWNIVNPGALPTDTQAGSIQRVCEWCGRYENNASAAFAPYSTYEYAGGIYMVRYYSEQDVSGSVLFRGSAMYKIAGQNYWAYLVTENPGALSEDDFSESEDAALVIPRPCAGDDAGSDRGGADAGAGSGGGAAGAGAGDAGEGTNAGTGGADTGGAGEGGSASGGTTFLAGDMNSNGVVNIVDAQIAYDMATHVYNTAGQLSVQLWLTADVNSDGFLDSADAFAIQRAAFYGW